MALFSFLVVLAITYNHGAARPADSSYELITKNGLDDSDDVGFGADIIFKIPTAIKRGLVITINGSLNTNDKTFKVQLLSSIGAQEDCRINFDFEKQALDITPAVDHDYESTHYDFDPSSQEEPKFSLRLTARETQHEQTFGMTFNGNEGGDSQQLICKIRKFEDINFIVMKEGVARVDSLLFEFEENH